MNTGNQSIFPLFNKSLTTCSIEQDPIFSSKNDLSSQPLIVQKNLSLLYLDISLSKKAY